ncbi:MAG: hypothetical protein Q8L80_04710 [Gallionella sp.]|nr:hypothetical protein [Gallionella sp.]MDP1940754.1 hypothetical protein [Gallionella sp.]
MKTEATKLIDLLNLAIRDFIQKVEVAPKLSAAYIEKANFIVGAVVQSTLALEHVEKRGERYYKQRPEIVDRLFREAAQFAASLQAKSCGIPARLSIPIKP